VDPLTDNVQFPGPFSGTSTVSNPGLSVPESSPLIAFTLEFGAVGRAVVVVTCEKLLSTDDVLFALFAVTMIGLDVVVTGRVDVVVVGLVVVVEFVTGVVTGDVEEGGGDEAAGARGVDVAVRVKTRTINRSGLDHIKRWALFSEKGERGIVFVG
jgi:hypothetical protein